MSRDSRKSLIDGTVEILRARGHTVEYPMVDVGTGQMLLHVDGEPMTYAQCYELERSGRRPAKS